jgi:hypothetical protein
MSISVAKRLNTWHCRLEMAERGITAPSALELAFIRQEVAFLTALEPTKELAHDVHDGRVRYFATETGELIAEFSLPPNWGPPTSGNE